MRVRTPQQIAANRARCRVWHDKHKKMVLDHYSGGKAHCSCCGENELIFLTLDHVDGKGAAHRRKLFGRRTGGAAIYRWAVNNRFPKMFRVLCFNCNFAIHNLGACPHDR